MPAGQCLFSPARLPACLPTGITGNGQSGLTAHVILLLISTLIIARIIIVITPRAIASAAPLKDKVNVLSYFETLCTDNGAANSLINSSLTILFIRMLRNARVRGEIGGKEGEELGSRGRERKG